ncbi:MAG: Aspartate aminotransferase family protein [Candidatus Poribacteria bacterium]|nr:Aspartate aminotransferase family protein [Candidatus Poribacteria bacterium]
MGTKRSFERSLQWQERARKVLMGGGQPHKRTHPPDPVIIERGLGSHIWDADGNEYIDYLLAYGPVLLGYGYPRVVEAVAKHTLKGNVYNTTHILEIELAEKLVELIPSAERVTYFVGGSDATTGAIKLARAYTGKEKIIQYGYHGWHDWCHTERGALLATGAYTLSMKFNDLESLDRLFREHRGGVACVIMEIAANELPDEGYLEGVKNMVHENDAVLIFDEVKTGFRYSLGGAQKYFGVTPDMSVFSKAMGNGFPAAAVVGKAEIMDKVADTWVAATFQEEVSLCAASLATIAEMEEKDGIAFIWKQGNKLLDSYREMVKRLGVEEYARFGGQGPMPFFGVRSNGNEKMEKFVETFYNETLDNGLYMSRGHVWFISLSHTDEDIARTLEISEEALKVAKQAI